MSDPCCAKDKSATHYSYKVGSMEEPASWHLLASIRSGASVLAEMWEGFSRKHTATLESGNGTALQRGAKSSPGPGKECKKRLLSFFPTRKESLLLLPERIHYWEHNKPGVGTSWLTPAEAMWHTVWHQQGFVSSHLIPEESHRDMGGTSHSWDSHPKVKYPLVNNWGEKIAVILSCPNF